MATINICKIRRDDYDVFVFDVTHEDFLHAADKLYSMGLPFTATLVSGLSKDGKTHQHLYQIKMKRLNEIATKKVRVLSDQLGWEES